MAALTRPEPRRPWVGWAIGTFAALLLIVVVGDRHASAQQQRPPSAAERRAQIDRIIDGLNSSDATTRIVTLEQAAANKDVTVRRIALSTAFASSDPVLRSTALAAAMSNAATFVVDLTPSDAEGDHLVLKSTNGSLELRVSKFDKPLGTFQSTSRYSKTWNGTPIWFPGAVSGDRISFDVEFDIPNNLVRECSGVARLQAGSSTLRGTMGCTGAGPEEYDIKIDVLR